MENQEYKQKDTSIVIIGGGSIGVSFAILFAKSNISVELYEPEKNRFSIIKNELMLRIQDLLAYDLIEDTKENILKKISLVNDISKTNPSADLVIECAPEKLAIKEKIFMELETIFSKDTIFSSASSAIMISKIASKLDSKNRCLITHPGNPPHLLPIVEIVPANFTDYSVINRTKLIFENVGQIPIILNKEIEGFVFNRLQGAILREAYSLIKDDITTVDNIDKVMTEGLGIRWSIIGPFETIDLNTRGGIISHAEKMGEAYARMGRQRGQNTPWSTDLINQVNAQRRQLLPMEKWEERVRWRDKSIMQLLRYRKMINKEA